MPSSSPRLFDRWPNGFTLFLFVLTAVNYFSAFTDLDWCWHVRSGQLILETGTLRHPDQFSYTIPGKEINDFEWLYEITLYSTWSLFGMGGLKFLRFVLVASTLAVLAWRLHVHRLRWHVLAITLMLAPLVVGVSWNLRPLFLTTLGILLVTGFLQDHCRGLRPLPWWFPAILWVWANTHPGVIIGQAMLAGAIGWEWLNRWLRWNPPMTREQVWRLTRVGGLALLATCISPDPWDRLLYPFRPELRHPIMRNFVEMQPLWRHWSEFPVVVTTTYAFALVAFFVVWKRFHSYRMWELAALAGTTLLANAAARSNQDWFLTMLVLTLPRLRDMLVEAGRADRRDAWASFWLGLDRRFKMFLAGAIFRLQPIWLTRGCVALLAISTVPPLCWNVAAWDRELWPARALDHLQVEGIGGNFFCEPNHGAYIGWRLKDRARVFADTRGFYFPPSLLEDSMFIPARHKDWRARLHRVLDEHPTDYFFLNASGSHHLGAILAQHVDRPIYKDAQVVVLTTQQVRDALPLLEGDARVVLAK